MSSSAVNRECRPCLLVDGGGGDGSSVGTTSAMVRDELKGGVEGRV